MKRQRSLKKFLQDYQWIMIGIFWLSAFILGFLGFSKFSVRHSSGFTTLDAVYRSLQLFIMESGSIEGAKCWELEAARFLAPAVAIFTALKTIALFFNEQLQLLRLKFMKGHVIICGLGRKGYSLASGFQKSGRHVVVIEKDEGNDMIRLCKDQGISVLMGDASHPDMLKKARVNKASHLISVCGNDAVNTEIALHAREIVPENSDRALTCIVHIVDSNLYKLLRDRELEIENGSAYRLEFFNIFNSGARKLLKKYPISLTDKSPGTIPHILVIGAGKMGETLITLAARGWWETHRASGEHLNITLIDRNAAAIKDMMYLRYPCLESACNLKAVQLDVQSAEFQKAGFLYNSQGAIIPNTIYICLDSDSLGLATALSLHQKVRKYDIPIIVRTIADTGLASLLERINSGQFDQIHAFSLINNTSTPELVLGGVHESIAKALHEVYSPLLPWDDLPDDLKESNRYEADHIIVKLKAVGCCIERLTDWNASLFTFTDEEVEVMSRMEHQRYVEERVKAGWKKGPRCHQKKTSPYLVPWDELTEEAQAKNRDAVISIPKILASVDLQVCRYSPYSQGRGTI